MADLQSRNFNAEYKGLRNQSIASLAIITFALCTFETLRRKRRKAGIKAPGQPLGSIESWEFA